MKTIIVIWLLFIVVIILFNTSDVLAFSSPNIPLVADADLGIEMTDTPDPVEAGEELTYTLLVTNYGPQDATGVTVWNTLPEEVTFISATDGCSVDAGVVTCNLGNLAMDDLVEITIVVIPDVEGLITNVAVVSGNDMDPNPNNNTDAEETTVTSAPADLGISITDTPDPVLVSSVLTYNLSINNLGPNAATNVTVVDNLPNGVSFSSASSGCTEVIGVVTCDVGSLGIGEEVEIIIIVLAQSNIDVITNQATVDGSGSDPVPDNNYDEESTLVAGSIADLQITSMIDNPDPVLTGNYLTYHIQVYNAGPGYAQIVAIFDYLPSGVVFVSGQECEYVGGTNNIVMCSIDSLVSHGSVDFSFTVITPNVAGIITNTAYVTGYVIDPVPDNNNAIEETSVVYELPIFDFYLPITFR
jgi:uncharacterized repeat protein (TIGR01451 family)